MFNVSVIKGSVCTTVHEGYGVADTYGAVGDTIHRLEAEGYSLVTPVTDLHKIVLTRGPYDRAIVLTVERRDPFALLSEAEREAAFEAYLVSIDA